MPRCPSLPSPPPLEIPNENRVPCLTLVFSCLVAAVRAADTSPAAKASKEATEKPVWLTSLPEALKQAKEKKKQVLLFVHGSDWCAPCIKMHKEVLETPEFAELAKRRFILLEVDFPAHKEQSEEQKKANLVLKEKFNISEEGSQGFPSVVILNSKGETVYQRKGYSGGGPKPFIEQWEKVSD